jgi:hypothetical protein
MSSLINKFVILSPILIILGSFLPWRQEGDLISYWTPGLRILPSIRDDGGFFLIILSILILMLVLKPPTFIRNPIFISILLSIALLIVTGYHVCKIIIDHISAHTAIGAPVIEIGLIMVIIGALLDLITTIMISTKTS